MYSNIKSVQILISLLKQFGITDLVLSPGGSDIPVIHSVETDRDFNCYSVVDERSAAYYAMGLAQEKQKPVACVCTSGTAVCNYVPGITEAYYQDVPVLAITADKNPYYQGQLETQKINQEHIFDGVVKKSVTLPVIRDEQDEWLCNRLVNEALLELNHHGTGPVQINIPIVGVTSIYDCAKLPVARKMEYVDAYSEENEWKLCANKLKNSKRIMVVIGQNVNVSNALINKFELFFQKYNCMFAVEKLSNVKCDGTINTYPISEMGKHDAMEALVPDVVISLGNNLAAYNLKPFLRSHYKEMENWLISPSGKVRDAYKSLTKIIESSPEYFFEKMIFFSDEDCTNNREYYDGWKSQVEKILIPELDYWNFMVGKELSRIIPKNSILHLAILNSTRMMQYFELNDGVRVYSNVGTLGIDGCLSSFAGQAAATDQLSFLLIGDLSFFYDMNAAGIRSIDKNVRIVMMNNTGGSEFHFFMGKDKIPTIDDYICAKHGKVAEGWIKSLGYEYYSAHNADELKEVLKCFAEESDQPKFLEVFTDMEDDAKRTRKMYDSVQITLSNKGKLAGMAKSVAKSILSDKQIGKAKKLLSGLKR